MLFQRVWKGRKGVQKSGVSCTKTVGSKRTHKVGIQSGEYEGLYLLTWGQNQCPMKGFFAALGPILLTILFLGCNTPQARPKPKFEIVEDIRLNYEGFIDLGCEFNAKIHNYGATGTQTIPFKLYKGYSTRNSNKGPVATWDRQYTHSEKLFLEAGQTRNVRHVFKQITAFDTGVRGAIEIN